MNKKKITSKDKIYYIGETWNCGVSGTAIICIGYAQITDNIDNNSNENYENFAKIIKDKEGTFREYFRNKVSDELIFQGENGLIFNVKCH